MGSIASCGGIACGGESGLGSRVFDRAVLIYTGSSAGKEGKEPFFLTRETLLGWDDVE